MGEDHSRRTGRSAMLLAMRLGLTLGDVWRIRRAAMLHDIGAELLAGSRSPVLEMAAEIALTHRERWDGTGHPRGLRGEAIPLTGRIVAVAGAFDLLTHGRPGRPALPIETALLEIEAASGSAFDPAVVAAFRGLPHGKLVDASAQRAAASPIPIRSMAVG